MNSATHWNCLSASFLVVAIMVAGATLSGCSPGPEAPTESGETPSDYVAPEDVEGEESGEAAEVEEGEAAEAEQPAETEEAPAEVEQPAAAEEPAELSLNPPVSTYAPAADLVAQVEVYLEDLEKAVKSEEEYNDSVENIAKQANTLILIALALGLHDSENQYKAAAPAMVKAAQDLAATGDYASAQAAVEAMKTAASSEGDLAGLKWEKIASLPELMKAVPLINSRLKRYTRDEKRMKGAVDDLAGYSAVLAVIGQGSMANSDETEKPEEVDKWTAFCVQMRDVAGTVNSKVRTFEKEETAETFEAAKVAILEDLEQSCNDCHEVFHIVTDEE